MPGLQDALSLLRELRGIPTLQDTLRTSLDTFAQQGPPRLSPEDMNRVIEQARFLQEYALPRVAEHYRNIPVLEDMGSKALYGGMGPAASAATRIPALIQALTGISPGAGLAGLAGASLVAPTMYAVDPATRERMAPDLQALERWWNDTADQYSWSLPSIGRWAGRQIAGLG